MNICDDEMLVLSENEKKLEQEYEAMKKSGASSEQLWSKAHELHKANEACNIMSRSIRLLIPRNL